MTDGGEASGGPISVALLTPGWPLEACANGVATYIATIAPELRRLGHPAHVLSFWVKGDGEGVIDLTRELGRGGPIDRLVRLVDPRAGADRLRGRAILRAARRLAEGPGPHVLEMEEAFGWPRRVRPGCPMPVVVRLHGPWFLNGPNSGDDPSSPAFARRVREERLALLAADGITAPSRDVLDRTRSYYGLALEGAEVIPYPAPVIPEGRRWSAGEADRDHVLFIGRFDLHKGGDTVIDAFALLHRDWPTARLTFVGPDRGLEREGRRWGLREYVEHRLPGALGDGRVRWLGQRPHGELDDLRRLASVTVVASRYETFAITIAEAMALGCPTVATRAGGAGELFEHGEHGLYAGPDDPAGLASAISAMLADPGRASAMGRRAAEYCERRYAPGVVAGQTIRFYRRVLAGRASRPATPGGARP
jgi:glycosyltransferase involved in cell wall biosynthesis